MSGVDAAYVPPTLPAEPRQGAAAGPGGELLPLHALVGALEREGLGETTRLLLCRLYRSRRSPSSPPAVAEVQEVAVEADVLPSTPEVFIAEPPPAVRRA
eukprot:gene9506-5675_t